MNSSRTWGASSSTNWRIVTSAYNYTSSVTLTGAVARESGGSMPVAASRCAITHVVAFVLSSKDLSAARTRKVFL